MYNLGRRVSDDGRAEPTRPLPGRADPTREGTERADPTRRRMAGLSSNMVTDDPNDGVYIFSSHIYYLKQ